MLSFTVIETLEKVPVAVGVPRNEMVPPDSVAVRPVGSPLCAEMLMGEVPPVTGMVPSKPDWFTVQALSVREPSVRALATGTCSATSLSSATELSVLSPEYDASH